MSENNLSEKNYDAEGVEGYFDQFGSQEWDRLVRTPAREVQLAVHNHAIKKFIQPSSKVLEIGAGAGRFTLTLAQLGAVTTVTDISQVQLDLNIANAENYHFGGSITEWRKLDMCDLSCYRDEAFDAVLCIGGPLSYVLDKRDIALREMVRVTEPGGVLILGVMSLWGTIHQYLDGVLEYSVEDNAKIIATGDLIASNSKMASHYCHMFRSNELRTLLEAHDLAVEFMSASNAISAVHADNLTSIRQDQAKWNELIRMEIEVCQQPGYLDGGTHLIAVARKPLHTKRN